MNTVVVFGPRADLIHVPFDAVFLSNIYAWFYVIAGRRSYMNKIRSHIYPTSVAELPWNDTISQHAPELEASRDALLALCERRFDQVIGLKNAAAKLGLKPLKEVIKAVAGAKIIFSEAFKTEPSFNLLVGEVVESEGTWALMISEGGEHQVIFDSPDLASLAMHGLSLLTGSEASRTSILNSPVPRDAAMADELIALQASFEPDDLDKKIDLEVGRIDVIIGDALGLTKEDILEIQIDMSSDPFLSRVKPRYPFFRPRQYGRRLNLERENRYATI